MDPCMAESRDNKQRPRVSLEQLIQLKRSERPPAEFWDGFDQELHRRQLAALVTVEPWYQRAARVLAAAARRIAPVGVGAAAVAFAAVVLVRVGPANHATPGPDASAATAEADAKIVLLPEESISVSAPSTPRSSPIVEEFRGNVRSAPQELASGLASARRFVAVAAPVTFSSENDASAIYSAKALTAGAVLRSLTAAAPESL